MNVKYEKSFSKDLNKLKNPQISDLLYNTILDLKESPNMLSITNLKKLKGYTNFYRIRITDYRLGIHIQDNCIVLVRFKHRKDIYKVFP